MAKGPNNTTVNKVCPILSVAALSKDAPRITTADGKPREPTPILCLGANCMFWHQIGVQSPQGVQMIEGCAVPHIASGLMAVRQGIDFAAGAVEEVEDPAAAEAKATTAPVSAPTT